MGGDFFFVVVVVVFKLTMGFLGERLFQRASNAHLPPLKSLLLSQVPPKSLTNFVNVVCTGYWAEWI